MVESWELLEVFAWGRGTPERSPIRGHQVLPQGQNGLEEAASRGRKDQGRRKLCWEATDSCAGMRPAWRAEEDASDADGSHRDLKTTHFVLSPDPGTKQQRSRSFRKSPGAVQTHLPPFPPQPPHSLQLPSALPEFTVCL